MNLAFKKNDTLVMEMSLNSGTTLSMNNMKIYENLNILYHKIKRNKYVILDILNMLMLKIHRCVTRYILLLITVQ